MVVAHNIHAILCVGQPAEIRPNRPLVSKCVGGAFLLERSLAQVIQEDRDLGTNYSFGDLGIERIGFDRVQDRIVRGIPNNAQSFEGLRFI
jgi:hypothetical protein